MPNTLKNILTTQLSTDSATLYTCPSSTKTIIIGMSAANILPNTNVNFSAAIMDSASDSTPTLILQKLMRLTDLHYSLWL